MKKLCLLSLVLVGLVFSGFAEITDNVNLEWSDNNFQAIDVAVGNIDSDPQKEIVVVGSAGTSWEEMGIAVFELSDTITLEDTMYFSPTAPVDAIHPTSVILCDVDGDGTKDIVTGGYNDIGISTERGFVYTYTFDGIISSQESYDGPTLVEFEALGAKQSGGKCNIHAVGTKKIPGNKQAYTAILNTDSGTLDISQETLKSWLSDSSTYGIDFFDNGTVITVGTAESGWTSTQHVTVTKNPGNITSFFGSTATNREATSVKLDNEEIIVGVDSRSILDDYAKIMLLDANMNELDSDIIYQDNVTMLYNSHVTDVDACDIDNDGTKEIFAAVDHYVGDDYGVLVGYNRIGSQLNLTLLETSKYFAMEEGYETGLQAIACQNVDADTREELIGVINLANSTSGNYAIKLVVLEEEPQIPVITVIAPGTGEAISGEYTAVIEVSDDSLPENLIVQYRVISSNLTSYYQAMDNMGYTFYEDINFSIYNDGPYTLQFKVIDEESNTVVESVDFSVDTEILTVSMINPPENSLITPGTKLVFSSSHPLSSFVYSVDGGANNTLTAPYRIETDTWNDGIRTVRVWANSISGQSSSDVFKVIIDGHSPVVTIHPSQSMITQGDDITVIICHQSIDCGGDVPEEMMPLIVIQEFGPLKQLDIVYNGITVDYLNSPTPITIDTSDWPSGTMPIKVVARDIAGNPAATAIFPISILASATPEPEAPPEDETTEALEDEASELIETAETEISEAEEEGKDVSVAMKALREAKRLFSIGKYQDSRNAAQDSLQLLENAPMKEEPVPDTPAKPEEKSEKPSKLPPGEATWPVPKEEQAVFDYTMMIWGVIVIAIIVAAYYVLRKPKSAVVIQENVKPVKLPREKIKPVKPKKHLKKAKRKKRK